MVKSRIDRANSKIGQSESSANNQFDEKLPQVPSNFETIDAWISDVKQKRGALLEKRHLRRQRKTDLAKRRTVAAQERMRIISQLARKDKDDDDFGMRDEDWDVYKTISKDGDSDSEVENEKLLEFESILRNHDPSFDEPQNVTECAAENNQVSTQFIHNKKNSFYFSFVSMHRNIYFCFVFSNRYYHFLLISSSML